MKNPLKTDGSAGLGLLAARVPMGIFFLVLGYWKLQAGVSLFVANNLSAVPQPVPREWGFHYLQGVPYAEVTVGAMLILGLLTRLAGFVGAAMVVTFMIGTHLYKADGLPFHPNFIYVGILLTIFLVGPGRISLDRLFFKKRTTLADVE
jgi:uncharacterized membrane protein YphA (DoxX/SURF4 family)